MESFFPAQNAPENGLFDNPTVRAINAASRFGYSVIGNNLQAINSTCAALNSSPVEYLVGNQSLLQNFEYGLTNPGFAHERILDSLKQIPIYKEVLDFKTSENESARVESISPLSAQSSINQIKLFSQKRPNVDVQFNTQSCSMNSSKNESSHPINDNKFKAGAAIRESGSDACKDVPEIYNDIPNYNQGQGNGVGSYMPIVLPKGSNSVIPPGYIEIHTEETSSRKTKVVTNCEHTDRKHYAKGLCSSCYHKNGRTKKSWNCEHKDRLHYAKGCCHECYVTFHSKRGQKKLRKTINQDLSEISKAMEPSYLTGGVF
ncbi:unnamed protein product [Moneuplotes crassus]|uniref:Uncharacterized protein n=1 Tax=Euplotes crassus TaxID=5936 RepID=A0AAD1UNP1_EUPCR|nr:unnamed protein product [Moneuplotes crassus]